MSTLDGKVVAIIGAGSDRDRAFAVACAEAGADVALATQAAETAQEFAMNSIANEVWAIGRQQFVRAMDAADATAVMSFADEVWDRMHRCDALIAAHDLRTDAPADELSPDEWELAIRVNLTAPFLAAQAFGRLMEREHGGVVLLVAPEGGDVAYAAARLGLEAVAEGLSAAWHERGVHVRCARFPDSAGIVAALSGS